MHWQQKPIMQSLFDRTSSRWSAIGLFVILMICVLPAGWLVASSLHAMSGKIVGELWQAPFLQALGRTLIQETLVVAAGLAVGWPYGIICGLTAFPGRRICLGLLTIPLFMPTFFWAIGLSSARVLFPYRMQGWFDGLSGCVFTSSTLVIPLVVFATLLAVRSLTAGQADSARLAGGFRVLFISAARFSLPISFAAAFVGGLLAMSDPGPAQIMGYHGIASEILIAFAARHDLQLAALKGIAFGVVVLPVLVPLSWRISAWLEPEFVGRDLNKISPITIGKERWISSIGLLVVPTLILFPAVYGFIRPFLTHTSAGRPPTEYALEALRQSAGTTLFYGMTAAVLATTLGLLLALCAGRTPVYRRALFFACFLILSMPPAIHALGVVFLGTLAPSFLDPLLRSGWTVGLGLGIRFLSVSAILCLYARSSTSKSLDDAAVVHGIPFHLYLGRVIVPLLRPALMTSILLVALLAAADVSSTLLLQPPGETTFTGRIFSVIDNASERLVAAMCLVYLSAGLVMVAAFWSLTRLQTNPRIAL